MSIKKLIPLQVSVKSRTWRLSDQHHAKADQQFLEVKKSVLDRDDYTCRGCGFRSPPDEKGASYQEIHHRDDDHSNNKAENLATLCPLCHQVFHVGFAGLSHGGMMIWLPEISQAHLNNICRGIFIAIVDDVEHDKEEEAQEKAGIAPDQAKRERYKSYSGSARSLYASFEERAIYMEEVFAPGASDPSFFGQALLESIVRGPDGKYVSQVSPEVLKGVRLLPSPGRFQAQIQHWRKTAYRNVLPASWPDLLKQYSQVET